MIPISAMESASSCKAIGSNSRRGWLGFTEILSSSISLMDDDPEVFTSSLDIRASSPRPNANFFVLPYTYLLFLVIISLAKAKWFLAPVDSAS